MRSWHRTLPRSRWPWPDAVAAHLAVVADVTAQAIVFGGPAAISEGVIEAIAAVVD